MAKKWQYCIASIGIFFGIFSLLFFVSLGQGVESSLEKKLFQHKEIISIKPLPKKISFLEKKLTDEVKDEISSWDEVSQVYIESSVMIPSFAQSATMLNIPIDVAFIHGLDDEFFSLEREKNIILENGEIPILVAPFALDFINSLSDQIPGFSGFSPERLLGQKISLTFGESAFIPLPEREKKIKAVGKIVGVTDIAPVVGITIPLSEYDVLAHKISFPVAKKSYDWFHIEINNPEKISFLTSRLQKMGFFVRSQSQSAEKVATSILLIKGVFFIFSGIILLLSFFFLVSIMSLSVLEHKKIIGIWRALGESKWGVKKIFYWQSFLVILPVYSIVLLVFFLVTDFLEEKFSSFSSSYSFFPESLFITDFFVLFILFFGLLFSTFLSVYLATRSLLKGDPMVALLEG